jgi:hypothetical protein
LDIQHLSFTWDALTPSFLNSAFLVVENVLTYSAFENYFRLQYGHKKRLSGGVHLENSFDAGLEEIMLGGVMLDAVLSESSAGCGNDNYCPDNPVTRGEMAVLLARTFGS